MIALASFVKWTPTECIHTKSLPSDLLLEFFNNSFMGLTPLETNRYYCR